VATLSTLSTPIATPLVNEDGTINAVWNEFFIRFMINAGITVSIDDLEADVSDLVTDVENVADEITASVTITDSDNNIASDTAKLYNGNKTSDGVEYTITTTTAKYIQYKFGIEDYVDRVSLWTDDADGRVFIAYSTNGTTWSYLSAEADHTLTSEGRLETATSEANATTEYWQLAAGVNLALFPNNTVVKYVRLYMVSGTYTTTIYELIFARMLIAEMAAIENIYALSATFGPMSGYADITDKPTTLAGINLTEGDKLTGIADGADVTYDQQGLLNLSPSDNLLPNPDFELGLDGWVQYTTETPLIDFEDATVVNVSANSNGGYILRCTNSVSFESKKYIPVDTTKRYYGEALVRATYIDSGTGSNRTYIGVRCYDYSKTSIGNTHFVLYNETFTSGGSTFTSYTGEITGEGAGTTGFEAATRYVRFMGLINYQDSDNDSAITDIGFCRFAEMASGATVGADTSNASSGLINSNITINTDGSLSGAGAGSVSLGGLGAGSIATLNAIANSNITSIDGGKITTGYVGAARIAAGSLNANKITSQTITATQMAANSINASELNANCITVGGGHISSLAVDTLQIADNAVTVPIYDSNTTSRNGTNSYILVETVTVVLDQVGYIFAWGTVDQDFAAHVQWDVYLMIDGYNVFATGGGLAHVSATVSGGRLCSAGSRVVRLYWRGYNANITHNASVLCAQGAMK